jgi:hypothetical protein
MKDSLMMRDCLNCHRPFTPADLSRDVSKGIEADRKAQGVQGVLFRCYTCAHCGHENLFVDLYPLQGETPEEFNRRRDELEKTIRQSAQPEVDVALIEKRHDTLHSPLGAGR